MNSATRRTVVIGLGNALMADDGAGLAALERLRLHPLASGVELVDGGTWGLNLLPVIEGADRVLLLDAVNAGAPPGTIIQLEGASIPRFLETKVSPHQVDLRDVLALAELRGTCPHETVVIGVQPARVEMAAALTPTVERQIGALVAAALARLESWGEVPAGA
jgi:hydrogenase maturation protease